MKVIISRDVVSSFVAQCEREYQDAEIHSHAPRYWAVLAGKLDPSGIEVAEIYAVAENLRDEDPFLIAQYDGPRAHQFGGVYKDLRRGYQADAQDLMRLSLQAESQGLDVLGSVHMHADLHNRDRPDELSPITTHLATRIDHELFRTSGWPLNMIVYVERQGTNLCWAMTAWVPPPTQTAQGDYLEAPILIKDPVCAPRTVMSAAYA